MIESKQFEAYEYNSMMKTSLFWIPFLTIAIYIAAFSGYIRYILFFILVGPIFYFILLRLKRKAISLSFNEERIIIDKKKIVFSDIISYHTCLPLNKVFMLRIQTNEKKEVFYIKNEYREEIEKILKQNNLPLNKTKNDIWLKYSHLTFAFLILTLAGIIAKVSYLIEYS